MTYTRPTDEQMPAALAEVMGWRINICCTGEMAYMKQNGAFAFDLNWSPLTDRNHSRLAVERCYQIGLKTAYKMNLAQEMGFAPLADVADLLNSTSAQESFAAHKTLTEHRQQKGKP
jgi:hypothetical protein